MSRAEKRLKDPIYGYISIPIEYINEIIDTAIFQRLRRIIQTSYSPLYSSAVHNRFVHSLGVYHLGRLASNQIRHENAEKCFADIEDFNRMCAVFELACLLHDVGHAPFSHTGEAFYLDDKEEYDYIHSQLIKYVDDDSFEVPSNKSQAAAPHEIMSAIVGLKEFAKNFKDGGERSFFARCITGYLYREKTKEKLLKNCFISLLNSKIIDVDKLDYLIRDAFITGFDTVNIDYVRLLSSLTIQDSSDSCRIVYQKSALSVIENVVYAHDSERKWIQNHPVVVYETYLLHHMIRYLSEKMDTDGKKLFSAVSLSKAGQDFANNVKIRLMDDDDIIYLTKNIYPSELGDEYFERSLRRHPAWKSEAEYTASFLGAIGTGDILKDFESTMENIGNYLKKNSSSGIINDDLLTQIENDLPGEDDEDLTNTAYGKQLIKAQTEDKKKMLKVLRALKDYAKSKDMKFDFVILNETQFISGFGKPDFDRIEILFPNASERPIKPFKQVVSSLTFTKKNRDKFFYLFYKRNNGQPTELDCDEISRILYREFI